MGGLATCCLFGLPKELLTVKDEVDEIGLCWPRRVLSFMNMGVEAAVVGELAMCCGFNVSHR